MMIDVRDGEEGYLMDVHFRHRACKTFSGTESLKLVHLDIYQELGTS